MFNFLNKQQYLDDPDVQLMLRVKEGERRAFDEILTKHHDRIYQFCYRFLDANASMAEDITQDTFLNLYQLASRYEPKAKLTTLLFQMARNACLNALRHKQTISIDEPHAPLIESESDIIAKLVEDERVIQVRKAIKELPENQRTAILLSRYELMSYDEIAKTMNTTVSAVKSLLNRAKDELELKLKKYINE